jgi:hypothetical protein
MHHGSELTWVMDPRNAQSAKLATELPFSYAKIGNKTAGFEDFSEYVNETTTFDKLGKIHDLLS